MSKIKALVRKHFSFLERAYFLFKNKYSVELNFWKKQIINYQKWYDGELVELFGEKCPREDQKIIVNNKKDSAILTWLKLHQQVKYLEDLQVSQEFFSGMKILDVGSGPLPSALVFKNCEVYCLDPLLPAYFQAGFPSHYYNQIKFVCAHSESMPLEDNFFDAVISVNAIDHVDDFIKTSQEIKRVLRIGGKLRIHMHYHPKTATEPMELNDTVVSRAYNWCPGFKKIGEYKTKRGFVLENEKELYTLWSN